MADRPAPVRRALLSVSDKTGLARFAQGLHAHGVELVSTGGTAAKLRAAGLPVTDVSDVTGFPEILDGRVKTLHPLIHGGILGRRDLARHRDQMAENAVTPIDLVAVDLYPFEAVAESEADFATCVENIDIGGPTLIRAAAKNHGDVTVVVEPGAYDEVLDALQQHGGAVPAELRRDLAARAFARTAAYDGAIGNWFAGQVSDDGYPRQLTLSLTRRQALRYGENPHQDAALYTGALDGREGRRPGVATARQLQGKALSYNNINDTDAAYELVAEFDDPAAVIVKHANPAGVAVGRDTAEAYRSARRCDPTSAFGGIVALNRPLDGETAAAIAEIFTEVAIAPDITPEGQDALARKTNLRVLAAEGLPNPARPGKQIRSVAGGALLQDRDTGRISLADLSYPTRRQPDGREVADLLFAFTVCKHVRSNAVVYARDGATVGIGAGQMSRVDSCRIAAQKARRAAEEAGEDQPLTAGSVVASDAFFPFPDGLVAAIEAGATAAIQPGGGKHDGDVIAAADERDVAMALTGMRHFKH